MKSWMFKDSPRKTDTPPKDVIACGVSQILIFTPPKSGLNISFPVQNDSPESRTLRLCSYGRSKHANDLRGSEPVFGNVDAYARGRPRSILRKRNKKKGRGRGSDHQRWPNAYFTTMGLYTLKQAHAVACESFCSGS